MDTPLRFEAFRQVCEIRDVQLGQIGHDLLARRPRRASNLKSDDSAQERTHDTKPEQPLQASPSCLSNDLPFSRPSEAGTPLVRGNAR